MEIRKPFFRTGAAIAAIAAVAVIAAAALLWPAEEEHVPAKLADAPDLFSFIRPMAETPAAPATYPSQPAQAPARQQESMTATPHDAASAAAPVEQEIRQLRNQGATDDEVYRLRAQRLSPEAADRLAHMEREESQWQARIALYLAERARLLSLDANAPGTAQPETLQQLRNAFFSPEEQERLAAYEPQHAPQLMLN